MAALGRHEGYFSTANKGTFVRTCVRGQRDMHPLGLTKVFRQETFSIWKWKFSAKLLSQLRSITGRGTVCCRSFLLKRVLPLLLLLTGDSSLLHLQGELLNLNILELEYVTEQEQSGKCFDIPTQHERVRGVKLFPFISISSCWVLVWGAGPCWGEMTDSFLVGLSGTREVNCGLRSLPVLGDPRFLKTLFLWFCAFDKFLAKPRGSSACLEATEGKSSPNKNRLALGTGWSATFFFPLLIFARTFFLRNTDSWWLADPRRHNVCSNMHLISSARTWFPEERVSCRDHKDPVVFKNTVIVKDFTYLVIGEFPAKLFL